MMSAMPPLYLDYQRSPPGRQLPGLVLLGLGLLLSGWLFSLSLSLSADTEQAIQRLSQLRQDVERQRLSAAAAAGNGAQAAGSEAASPAGGALGAGRWEALLGLLETAGDESVTLLSLVPGNKEILITGEARNLEAVLDYVQRLQGASVLARPHLSKYEVVAEHPQRPTRFTLQAEWREGGS